MYYTENKTYENYKNKNGIFLNGNWKGGWSIDLHTLSSTYLDNGNYVTKRTDIGELLYQFKYCNNYNVYKSLTTRITSFSKNLLVMPYISAIIPVPPSDLSRSYQPTIELAKGLGKSRNINVYTDYLIKKKYTSELKSTSDPDQRKKILHNAFSVRNNWLQGKKVLLFDDLYRSGSTLNEISKILYKEGRVSDVYVLTVTKTRSNR
tara:strand:- start:483 stop:1100 length:618 start_codon:yes stop_codon:yes gene_type:complete